MCANIPDTNLYTLCPKKNETCAILNCKVIAKIKVATFFETQCSVTSNNMKLVHWPLMGGTVFTKSGRNHRNFYVNIKTGKLKISPVRGLTVDF